MKSGIRFGDINIIPDPDYARVGQVSFLSQDGSSSVSLSAPDTITTTVVTISAASNVSSVLQCTTSSTTSMLTGQSWYATGITGSGFAPGIYIITVVNGTTFSLNGITATGSYSVASATATQNTVWRLPNADGSAGSSLVTDGVGNLVWGTATSSSYVVPISSGTATPNCSQPLNVLTETVDTFIATPVGLPGAGTVASWSLMIVLGVAGCSTQFAASYAFSVTATDPNSPLNSKVTMNLTTDSTGTTQLISTTSNT